MKGFEAQQVYTDCCKLRALTMEAQHCMTKADRITYGNELKAASGNLVRYFVLAWGAYTKRLDRIDDFIGEFSIFTVDFRFCNEHNVIKEKKTIAKDDPNTPDHNPGRIQNEIADCLSRIDEGIHKYRRQTEGMMRSEPGVRGLIRD